MGRPKTGTMAPRAAVTLMGEFRESVVHVKGTPDYFDFVDRIHRETGLTKVQMFRMAFADWCRMNGHGTPPEI